MALTLGSKPESLRVLLNPGFDFMFMLRPAAGSAQWEEGSRLELTIGDLTYAATVTVTADSSSATWVIEKDEVDAILAQPDLTARLAYIQPDPSQSDQELSLPMAKGVAINNG